MRLRKGKNAGKSNFWKVASNELWIVPKNKRSQQFGVFVNIWLFPRCSDYLAARVISKGEKAVPRHHFLPRVDSCAACLCKSCHLWSQRRWFISTKIWYSNDREFEFICCEIGKISVRCHLKSLPCVQLDIKIRAQVSILIQDIEVVPNPFGYH